MTKYRVKCKKCGAVDKEFRFHTTPGHSWYGTLKEGLSQDKIAVTLPNMGFEAFIMAQCITCGHTSGNAGDVIEIFGMAEITDFQSVTPSKDSLFRDES